MIWIDVDTSSVRDIEKRLEKMGKNTRPALARAIQRVGDMPRTQMVRALTKQTGLKRGVIVSALKKKGGRGSLFYMIKSRGGDIALKHFGARETRKGVSAAPFGKRQVFPSAFIKGGRFPQRVPLKLGGQVWRRVGAARKPLELQKSGVIIPKEMVSGASKVAFERTVKTEFPKRIQHELFRL